MLPQQSTALPTGQHSPAGRSRPLTGQAAATRTRRYARPRGARTPRLFCNKDLFKRARVTAPRSWAELRDAARALKAVGVPTPYGLQLGPEAAEDEALAWLLADGGGYAGLTGYDFATPGNIATLTWLRDNLVRPGLAGADPKSLTRTDAYAQFLRGRIGMMIAHPVLMGAADKAEFPYAHAPFPEKTGGAAPPVGLNDWLMAFRQNGRRERCGAFLGFLYGRKSALEYGGSRTALPVTSSAAQTLRENPEQRPMREFIDQMPQARFQPTNLGSWPKVRSAVRRHIGEAVGKGGDPRAVLEALDTTATRAEL
ncbi:extracellular solute-binding protein [Streptomyces sp. NPDC005562]|uniref:extracellular solute-binding protein n=1 Tax=unclassified Streptomyces TaxID=2593676 RepID=UPI0033A67FB6